MAQDTGRFARNTALTGPADLGLIPRPTQWERLRVGAASAAKEKGQVAQLVEQRIENPRVGGSIPPLATSQTKRAPEGALFV